MTDGSRDSGFGSRHARTSDPTRSPKAESPIPNPQSRIPALYAILDVDVAARAGWAPRDLAAAFLAGGARVLQLRAKGLAGAPFLDLACELAETAHGAGAILIVNDRADIARLASADGVHVGQEDLAPAAARAIVGPDAIVGVSTHTVQQIDGAVAREADALSYIAVGPVFGTATKSTGYGAVGLDRVRHAAGRARARGLDLVAIGGITLDRAAEVLAAGATSVAVITDLLTGPPEARVRAYIERLAEVGKV